MAGNTSQEAAALGRQIRSAKETEPYSFAFGLAKSAADSTLVLDKSKAPKSLESEAKRGAGNGAKIFSGKVYCDGSDAIFLTDDAPSNGEKAITDWLKHHKISLSVDVSKPEADGDEDDEGPKIYLTETLITRFRFALRNPVNFAFGPGKEKGAALLALHPRRGGRMMYRGIRRENHSIRGNWGILEMEGRVANFRCDEKPIPGLRKQIRAFLRSRDLRYRVKVFAPEGEVIEPGDEEEDALDLAAEQQGQQDTTQDPQPEAPTTAPPGDDGAGTDAQRLEQMRAQMQRMIDPLKEIAEKVPARRAEIRDLHQRFQRAQQAADVAEASNVLDALREHGRAGRADMQALATMRERLDAQLPELQRLFQQRPDDAPVIRSTWQRCDAALKAGDVATAREALFELASIAGSRERPDIPRGTVNFRQLLLRWNGAQRQVATNIQALGTALLAHADVQRDARFEQVRRAVAELPRVVPQFGDELQDALDAIINAGPEAKARGLIQPAIDAVRSYAAELDKYPEMTELEALARMVGAGNLRLGTELGEALSELQETLRAAA